MTALGIAQHFGRSSMLKVACLALFNCLFANSYSQKIFDQEMLLQGVKQGSWTICTKQLEAYFASLGLSVHDSLHWSPQAMDSIYNYYDNLEIVVSEFPTKKRVWEYWQNWSDGLAKGTWNPKKYFRFKGRALEMANYHTLMMLTHELGHHLAQRYDVERTQLNCKEYQADLACVSLGLSLAESRKGAKMKNRYIELLANLNAYIPHGFSELSTDLKTDCSSLNVQYPSSPELMGQYASAYCQRHRLLHDNPGYSTVEELVNDQYLTQFNSHLASFPAAWSPVELIDEKHNIHEMDFQKRFDRGIKEMEIWGASMIYRSSGFYFDDKGDPYHFDLAFPELLPEGGVIEMQMRDWNGALVDRRQYYAEQDLRLNGIRSSSMIRYGEWGLALLQVEDGNEGEHLILYKDSDGLEVERMVIDHDADVAEFKILDEKGGSLIVAEMLWGTDGRLQIMTFELDARSGDIKNQRVIVDVELQSERRDWQICLADRGIMLAVDGFVHLSGPEPIFMTTIAGTGLTGNKHKGNSKYLSEFHIPQALGARDGVPYMIDRRSGTGSMDDRVYLRKFILD